MSKLLLYLAFWDSFVNTSTGNGKLIPQMEEKWSNSQKKKKKKKKTTGYILKCKISQSFLFWAVKHDASFTLPSTFPLAIIPDDFLGKLNLEEIGTMRRARGAIIGVCDKYFEHFEKWAIEVRN